jgi:hypothetical protein
MHIMAYPKFFAACVFGVAFVIIGNTAANSINFGQNILLLAGQEEASYGGTLAIGIGATTCACILHGLSRQWGIRLNNFLGLSKFLILLFLIIIGFAAVGVLLKREPSPINDLSPGEAFHSEAFIKPIT